MTHTPADKIKAAREDFSNLESYCRDSFDELDGARQDVVSFYLEHKETLRALLDQQSERKALHVSELSEEDYQAIMEAEVPSRPGATLLLKHTKDKDGNKVVVLAEWYYQEIIGLLDQQSDVDVEAKVSNETLHKIHAEIIELRKMIWRQPTGGDGFAFIEQHAEALIFVINELLERRSQTHLKQAPDDLEALLEREMLGSFKDYELCLGDSSRGWHCILTPPNFEKHLTRHGYGPTPAAAIRAALGDEDG